METLIKACSAKISVWISRQTRAPTGLSAISSKRFKISAALHQITSNMSSSEAKVKLYVSCKGGVAQRLKFKCSELSFSLLKETIKTAFSIQDDNFKLITKDSPNEPEYEIKMDDVEDLSNCQQILIQTPSNDVKLQPFPLQHQSTANSTTTNSIAQSQQAILSSNANKKESEKRSLVHLFNNCPYINALAICFDR